MRMEGNGIPKTSLLRKDVAGQILDRAELFAISREDIVIDGLAIFTNTDMASAMVFIEAIRMVTNEFVLFTTTGGQQHQFGMP